MAVTLLTKNRVADATVPNPLQQGELAVNLFDNKLYAGPAGGGAGVLLTGGGGTVLPGTIDQTLRHNGTDWVPNSDLNIDASGDVLIGTTTKGWDAGLPKLIVSGGIQSGLQGGNDWHITIDAGTIKATGVSGVVIGMEFDANNYSFSTSSTEVFSISNGGSVTLHPFAGGGNTTASIDNSGRLIRTGSDRRLKKDIASSTYGLAAIEALKPVEYRWIDVAVGGTSLQQGFIAQDVETVIPEAVHEAADGMKNFEAVQLIGPLVNAVKELAARVEQLEA